MPKQRKPADEKPKGSNPSLGVRWSGEERRLLDAAARSVERTPTDVIRRGAIILALALKAGGKWPEKPDIGET